MALHILSEGPLVSRLGWTILHSLWEVLAVAVVLALILPALRRRGPRAAYAGCCLALASSMLLPVLTFCLLPSSPTNLDVSAGTTATVVDQPVVVQTETPLELSSEMRMPVDHESLTVVFEAPTELTSASPHQAAPLQMRTAEMVQRLKSSLVLCQV